MSNINVIKPKGELCELRECPVGLFLHGDTLCVLTEYTGNVFIVESGEAFWAGTNNNYDRYSVTVQPCEIISEGSAFRELFPKIMASLLKQIDRAERAEHMVDLMMLNAESKLAERIAGMTFAEFQAEFGPKEKP